MEILETRAGRSPTFQDPGTPIDGLLGMRQFNGGNGVPDKSFDVDLYLRVSL